MKEKKGKINLVIAIFIVIIIAAIVLIMVHYLGLAPSKNNDEKVENTTNQTENNTEQINLELLKYVIQFNENLLGNEFAESGDEIKGCNYEIAFLENNKFSIYMNFGNVIEGTYEIVDNNIINCKVTSALGEYSPSQPIEGKITFKINSENELEIIEIPETYTINITEYKDEKWVLTDETKEMVYWPLVKGIKYTLDS